jgi:hypothetical protein
VWIASGRHAPRGWLPALILALPLSASASADVVIRGRSVSEGPGGSGDGTTSRMSLVAGDRIEWKTGVRYTPGTAAGGP